METPGITAAPSTRTSYPLAPKISPLLPGSEYDGRRGDQSLGLRAQPRG